MQPLTGMRLSRSHGPDRDREVPNWSWIAPGIPLYTKPKAQNGVSSVHTVQNPNVHSRGIHTCNVEAHQDTQSQRVARGQPPQPELAPPEPEDEPAELLLLETVQPVAVFGVDDTACVDLVEHHPDFALRVRAGLPDRRWYAESVRRGWRARGRRRGRHRGGILYPELEPEKLVEVRRVHDGCAHVEETRDIGLERRSRRGGIGRWRDGHVEAGGDLELATDGLVLLGGRGVE